MNQKVKQGLLCILFIFAIAPLFAQKKKNKPVEPVSFQVQEGVRERMFWVSTIYKISYPVIHNLAEGKLRKNMPLETAPGYGLSAQKVSYLEAVGRTMAGIAPWLELADDSTKEGLLRKQMKQDAVKGLTNAVDPSSPDYLNFRAELQPIVDAAYLAHAFLRAPRALWEPLDEITKKRFVEEFKSLRNRTGAYNNWLLFTGITEAFLLKIGEQYDPLRTNIAIRKMKEWYSGDGWYSDGEKFSMDYYNDYVIHPMLVDMLKVLTDAKKISQQEYETALQRMIRHAEYSERIISPEGTYPVFGRSITYRTAAFQTLSQVALMEKLPEYIKPAQVRSALTKVFHNMFDDSRNFDANGWLVLGFNGHQPDVADTYTSTGSLYMASLGFLALGLPAENKFWTDAPAEWSSQKAWGGHQIKKDYKVEY